VHISAVERPGLSGLAEGQKVAFEIKTDRMRGKVSADNLFADVSRLPVFARMYWKAQCEFTLG
jgi:'Cold-shock' DNA-binding domain